MQIDKTNANRFPNHFGTSHCIVSNKYFKKNWKLKLQSEKQSYTSVKTCFPSLNVVFAPGVRQEQDIYVRLIDSVTKQVGGNFSLTLMQKWTRKAFEDAPARYTLQKYTLEKYWRINQLAYVYQLTGEGPRDV